MRLASFSMPTRRCSSSAWDPRMRAGVTHAFRVTKRAQYMFALYAGSVADPGDRNPYAGRSLVLAKLWMRGYRRMLLVRIRAGPAMQRYLAV